MTETAAEHVTNSKLRRKLFAGVLIVVGLSLVIGAIYFALVPNAEDESGSLPKTVGQIIAFILGAGANIKGWMDLLKKEKPVGTTKITTIGDNPQITTGTDSPNVQGHYIKQQVVYQTTLPPQPSVLTGTHQLPAPPADFTGREKELKELRAKIQSGGVTISGIQGMGGIGKTALALQLADMLAPQFPDGQIFLDLRGVEKQAALTAADAMRHVIVSFEPTAKLPDEPQQLAALYRSLLSGKKVLLLWDNVLSKEQVQPLLVKGCLTLVTSRQHFTLPGLEPLDLNTLAKTDARVLIRKIAQRIKADDADALASLCDYLPLAITLAASMLAERPDLMPEVYIERLKDAQTRLGLVNASIQLSYELLTDELKLRFRQLGVFPAPFDRIAAQAVWQVNDVVTNHTLGELLKFSLLSFDRKLSRYLLHDFLRSFGLSRMTEQEADHAFQAHSEYYFKILETADALFFEGGKNILDGLKLFDSEWLHISFAQNWAGSNMNRLASAAKLCNYKAVPLCLGLRLHPRKRIEWLEISLQASRLLMDREGESIHLGNLGDDYYGLSDMQNAIEFYEQASAVSREIGDQSGEGVWLGNLGIAYADQGDVHKAIEFYERAMAIAREIGDRKNEGAWLDNLGNAYRELGEARKGIEFYEQALAIVRKLDDRYGEAATLGNLGNVYRNLEETHKAIKFHEQGLAISRQIGDRKNEGTGLANLGLDYADLGDVRKAIEFYEQALAIAREIGDQGGKAFASWNLGLAYEKLGEIGKAISAMQICVDYEREIGHCHNLF